jgi:hypothetical protein
MLPASVTQAVMAQQMPAVTAWAERYHWWAHYEPASQLGVIVAPSVVVGDAERPAIAFYFDTAGFDAEPPAWWCGPVPRREETEATLHGLLATLGDNATTADLTTRATMACTNPRHYPAAATGPVANGPNGSIFQPNPTICAPWNRLAYQAHNGIHATDWTSTADWKTTATDYTQAHTIADMLDTLRVHLRASPGMAAA